jgi:hypothetical protein
VALPVSKSKKWKPFEREKDGASVLSKSHGPDIRRERPAAMVLSASVAAVNESIEAIDPVKLLLPDVPERALAEIVVRIDDHVDLEHTAPPEPFSSTVNSRATRVK